MPDFNAFLPLLSLMIALMAAVGVVVAFVGNRNRGLSEVQNSTIVALQAQNLAQEKQMDAQDKQIATLEKKIVHLERVFSTLQVTLKRRRGLLIEVQDDLITIVDQRTGTEQAVKIKIDSDELNAIDRQQEDSK